MHEIVFSQHKQFTLCFMHKSVICVKVSRRLAEHVIIHDRASKKCVTSHLKLRFVL